MRKTTVVAVSLLAALSSVESSWSAQPAVRTLRPITVAPVTLQAPITVNATMLNVPTVTAFEAAPLLSALPQASLAPEVGGGEGVSARVQGLIGGLERVDSQTVAAFFDGGIPAPVSVPTVGRAPDFEKVKFRFTGNPGWLESELMKDMMRHSWDAQVWPFLRRSMAVPAGAVEKTSLIARAFQADGLRQKARIEVVHPTLGSFGEFEYRLEKSSAKMTLRRVDGGR